MRRSRASLAVIALASLASWACAETLTVNTTTDDNQANDLCSLREAVEYFNLGRPADGHQGCKAEEGGGNVIELPAKDEPYRIEGSAIVVRTGITINGEGRKEAGSITRIQVIGRHRAFIVHDDPQYLAPKCSADDDCASRPLGSATLPTFDLDTASDTAVYAGTTSDYLTDLALPEVRGRLAGITRVPLPANSYLVRVFQVAPPAEPVEVGRTTVAFSASDMDWSARLILPSTGIVNLRYTLQEINVAGTEIGEPTGIDDSPALRFALVAPPARILLRLTKLVLSGGCEALTADVCATPANDTTTIINNPAGAGYDAAKLSYRYALSGTDDNGGIIFSTEKVALSDVLVEHGQAVNGGALYSAADGGVEIDSSELRENRAVHGAAVFAEGNSVKVTTSLLTENDVLLVTGGIPAVDASAGGAIIEVATATVPAELPTTTIHNTTFSANRGIALSLRTGGVVNGTTIVSNDGGGIQFNSQVAGVFNTILVLNGPVDGSRDCLGLPGSPSLANNLLLSTGSCPTAGNVPTDNQANTDRQLMATLVGGRCASQWGLLCPLADHGGATFVHRPRVLESYLDTPLGLGASLIINRGDNSASGSVADCLSTDQRGESRPDENCSIGAVELQTVEGEPTSTGGVIKQGDTWTRLASLDLGDEEFLTAARCEQMFPPRIVSGRRYPPVTLAPDISRVVADSYAVRDPGNLADTVVTAAGCPWIERPAERGVVTFSPGGEYNYRPTSTFHGLDRFDFRAVTTVSALNVLPADRSRLLKGRVIVEPGAGLSSDKVGGVFDLWGIMLLALAGLAWRRGGQA